MATTRLGECFRTLELSADSLWSAFKSCELRKVFMKRLPQGPKRSDRIIIMLESVVPVFSVFYQKEMLPVTVIPEPIQFSLKRAIDDPELPHFGSPLCIPLFLTAKTLHRIFRDALR